MPNSAAFPYPGGKSQYAAWIIEHLADHEVYVEPFGGAAGVLVNKPPSPVEVYNDLDESVANVFRVLREDGDALRERLRSQPYAEADYRECLEARRAGERPDDRVEWAAREFFLRYAHFGARLEVGRDNFRSSTESDLAGRFSRAVDRLEALQDRFREVTITCSDWRDVVSDYDTAETVFYFDPPYPDADNRHYDGHAGFDDAALVEALADLEGRFALSYGEDPPDGLSRYHTVTRETSYTMARGQAGDDPDGTATERLYLNYDPDAVARFATAEQATISDALGGETDQ